MVTLSFDSSTEEKVQWRLDNTDWASVLRNVDKLRSYYVGGGLFIDLQEGSYGFHLDGSLIEFQTGLGKRLSLQEHQLVFNIYLEHKGETNHYKRHALLSSNS